MTQADTEPGPLTQLRRSAERLAYGITHPDEELTKLQRLVRYWYALGGHAQRQLARNNASIMAAGLAYRTLFSLIPVLVLSLVVLRPFVGTQQVTDLLKQVLDGLGLAELVVEVPASELAGPTPPDTGATTASEMVSQTVGVSQWIEQLVGNAQNYLSSISFSSIAVAGVFVFIYAALSLFLQIERCFNIIYESPERRSLWIRIMYSWGLLTLGSVAAAASALVTTTYTSDLSELPSWLGWANGILKAATHIGIAWLVFFAAYQLVPAGQVKPKSAAAGALLAAVAFEIGKNALVWFVSEGTGGQVAIYGALALVPLLLLWVYITWIIILFGLQFARAMQTVGSEDFWLERRAPDDRLIDPLVCLALLRHIAIAFATGEPLKAEHLAHETRLPTAAVRRTMRAFVAAGFVHEVTSEEATRDEAGPDAYTLARPAASIALAAAIDALHGRDTAAAPLPAPLAMVRERSRTALDGLTLQSLVDDPRAADPAA
ncbi:MAG: YihY/virulence factor BrkB family protein [Planctomycetota bacterium]